MKKNYILNFKSLCFFVSFCLFLISGNSIFAKQVPENLAKTVAENFFKKQSKLQAVQAELKYTAFDSNGMPLYYAFNINANSGFVIISAEDAAQPIIGYSTERSFEKPSPNSTAAFWLNKRQEEIKFLKENNIQSNTIINSKWYEYATAQSANKTNSSSSNFVTPLLSSTWNQSPYYNDSCPGGSVTGCVATAMGQIMKYWSYPAKGTGSSSYMSNYGTLSANYSASNYNWNAMPLSISNHNQQIAKLMYDCGVSVQMNYSPSESGAYVISSENPICAQHSYTTYFGYDPSTISGVFRMVYSDNAWYTLLKNDLNVGRPIQYVGSGPGGGHTWVCDGYDQNDFFHMNWGWGGSSNGYFSIDALNPSGMDFNSWQEGLMGIVPIATNQIDAAVVSISPTSNGCFNNLYGPVIKIRNYGSNTLTSCVINYKLDNGATQNMQWTGSLITGQSDDINLPFYVLANGPHTFTCYISNPNNGVDANTVNDQSFYSFAVFSTDNLPLSEGFEVPSATSTHWSILPAQSGSNWAFNSQAFYGGSKSIMIDNLANVPGNTSILQGMNSYDFSATQDPYIHFKVAYQQKTSSNNDKLRLEVSNDCGSTWWVKWSKQGSALASTTVLSTSAFLPDTSQFIHYRIPGLMSSNVIFRWVFVSDATAPGNNLYLDDINIFDEATVGIKTFSSDNTAGFELFPNPSNGETFIKLKLNTVSSVEMNVVDIYGRNVIASNKTQYNAGEQVIAVNKENTLSKGIYFVTINANGIKSTRKLVIN